MNRDDRLHNLLLRVDSDRINRHAQQILIDHGPANLAQTLGVSTLHECGWLIWISPHHTGNPESCVLSPTGIRVLLDWEQQLWGPVEAVLSDRPLTACCLDDLGLDDSTLAELRDAFTELDQRRGRS